MNGTTSERRKMNINIRINELGKKTMEDNKWIWVN